MSPIKKKSFIFFFNHSTDTKTTCASLSAIFNVVPNTAYPAYEGNGPKKKKKNFFCVRKKFSGAD